MVELTFQALTADRGGVRFDPSDVQAHHSIESGDSLDRGLIKFSGGGIDALQLEPGSVIQAVSDRGPVRIRELGRTLQPGESLRIGDSSSSASAPSSDTPSSGGSNGGVPDGVPSASGSDAGGNGSANASTTRTIVQGASAGVGGVGLSRKALAIAAAAVVAIGAILLGGGS